MTVGAGLKAVWLVAIAKWISNAEAYLAGFHFTFWLKMEMHTQNRKKTEHPIEVQN